jgi:hypothetical protein
VVWAKLVEVEIGLDRLFTCIVSNDSLGRDQGQGFMMSDLAIPGQRGRIIGYHCPEGRFVESSL